MSQTRRTTYTRTTSSGSSRMSSDGGAAARQSGLPGGGDREGAAGHRGLHRHHALSPPGNGSVSSWMSPKARTTARCRENATSPARRIMGFFVRQSTGN
ncbi:uncharacterized protein dctn1b [Amphiprion ocellaris]|uniref:uncharacterized protein dctn1b n=1 Tax=Amphiprion ocellaris TaxID=80972 RepID=UPI0024117C23|nr:uncharacterized protein dctn1b [Amphiprion ocellaris]